MHYQRLLFSRECNPDIHNEIPKVEEYKSRKNLRNLVQAYSTSSHRPSYERTNSKYGLYAMHLSKYISKNIPVIKVFEEVGKCKIQKSLYTCIVPVSLNNNFINLYLQQ